MFYILETVIFVALLALWWFKKDKEKYSKYPPGPIRFPFVGNVVQVLMESKSSVAAFSKLAEKYGDVMFLKMGAGESVVFTSYESVKGILVHENTAGRTQFESIRDLHNEKNLGIIWGYDMPWQNLRRFTIRNLREYGFGKTSTMDAVITSELGRYLEYIKKLSESAPNHTLHIKDDMFNLTFINVLWLLVSGKSFEYNDDKMKRMIKLIDDFFKSSNLGMDITHVFPILREWFPKWSGRALQREVAANSVKIIEEMLEEEKARGTWSNDPQNFLDLFLAKIYENRNDPNSDFNEEQFVMTILDLLIGGSETSSKTLTFGILYMLLHPKIQEKVQTEIDRNIPDGVPIDVSMKAKLPYTTATVLEIFRYSTIVPITTAREVTEDTYFRGYLLRKGTAIMCHLHAAHFSKSLWGDPENFRPERFLNPEGTMVNKKMADYLISFGAGRRFCLGQSLAESTVFMYFAACLRNFKFEKIPGENPSIEPNIGITSSPQPFNVKIVDRNK